MATKTYGTVSADRQKAMSGFDFVSGLASGMLPLNTMAQTLGYDVVRPEAVGSSSPSIQQMLTSIHGARYTAVSRLLFSIAAWAWPSNRRSKRASAVQRLSSRFHFFERSH
jgi:hypothetical protein